MPITDARWSGPTTRVIETETGADGLTIADVGVAGTLIDNGGAGHNVRHVSFAGGAKGDADVNANSDDTAAFLAAIAAVPPDGRLIVPRGTYRLTAPLVFPYGITFDAAGARFVIAHDGHGLVWQPQASPWNFGATLTGLGTLNLDIGAINRATANIPTQSIDARGLLIFNSYNGLIRFGRIVGHSHSITMIGGDARAWMGGAPSVSRGCVHNDVFAGYLEGWKNLEMIATHGGWNTANRVYGGHFAGGAVGPGAHAESWHIIFQNASTAGAGCASNSVYGSSLEGFGAGGVRFTGGAARNILRDIYTELGGFADYMLIDNANGGFNNEVHFKKGGIDALRTGTAYNATNPLVLTETRLLDTRNSRLRITGADINVGYADYQNGQWLVTGDVVGGAKPGRNWTPMDGNGVGIVTALLQYGGTQRVWNVLGTRRLNFEPKANVPAGGLLLAGEPFMDITGMNAGSVAILRPRYVVEINIPMTTVAYTVDPQFIAGYTINYGHHPRPNMGLQQAMTYRMVVTPALYTYAEADPEGAPGVYTATLAYAGSIDVASVRGKFTRLAATAVTSAPEYVGQLASVSGVGYMATGTTSAADWKQITA